MIYQIKRFLLTPWLAWQRRKHGGGDGIGTKILEVNLYSAAIKRWFKDNAKTKLLLEHELGPDSVVYDVGGYKGEWTEKIVERYDPHVEVFEAVPGFIRHMTEQYAGNAKVNVHPYGLIDTDREEHFLLKGPGSSNTSRDHAADARTTAVQLRDAVTVFDELGHQQIDLLKINIEGGEFPLLRHLLNNDRIKQCQTIMIQYHEWIGGAYWNRFAINRRLSKTHRRVWNYPFVWEKWERLPN